jgi:GT2 family glycosyltransferase
MGIGGWEYVMAPDKGLSRARNVSLAHTRTSHIAWIDDDEIADVHWVRRMKEGFAHPSNPVAVCGVMLPAELESEAQVRFEQYGGFNKGRGLVPEVLYRGAPTVLSPMYPLPAVGSGGNMAFEVAAVRAVGGFDQYLGAGTRTHGGEETRIFALLLRAGYRVLHWPAAVTWHFHRYGMDELHKQFFGYSAGLSAFYASMGRSDPLSLLELARLVPHALRDLGVRSGGLRSDQLPPDFPSSLLRESRKGLIQGGYCYVREALAKSP